MGNGSYPSFSIVIADDEENIIASITYVLKSDNISHIVPVKDSREVIRVLEQTDACVLFLDLTMPHITGQELIPVIRSRFPQVAVIVITGNTEIETAVECMRLGVSDYLVKPIEPGKLIATVRRIIEIKELERENRTLRKYLLAQDAEHPEAFEDIITQNKAMKTLFLYVESIAQTDKPVLITGETGVGKELFAQAIHRVSRRKDATFLAVNVASYDETMFNDTLFGHVRGAYTGADTLRKGLVETAAGGTLFLDEIGDLPQTCQVKLLRLLEVHEFFPLGSDIPKRSNARLVCATNRNLKAACETGSFRNDLYYRLVTHHLHIPPLKERPEDIPLLIERFVLDAVKECGKPKIAVSQDVVSLLKNYAFPGNVRELKSILFDAVSMERSETLSIDLVRESLDESFKLKESPVFSIAGFSFPDELPTIKDCIRMLVDEALRRSGGNQTLAAKYLGITQQALNKRIKQRRADELEES
jgi:DNA-binding NtrC family response regulator